MQPKIHVCRNRDTLGVFTEDQLKMALGRGSITENDYCWTDGMKDWKPIGQTYAHLIPTRPSSQQTAPAYPTAPYQPPPTPQRPTSPRQPARPTHRRCLPIRPDTVSRYWHTPQAANDSAPICWTAFS